MGRDWILPGISIFERLAALRQPVIAAISGHALGGGLELALTADLRVAIKSARFGSPEVTLGMISGWMGIRRLAEIIGVARARHLTLLGAPITADVALNWGLITALAEDADDLERQLNDWLERLSANGPTAMELTKGILATMHADLRQHHASAAAQALSTDDCKEGVNAFREKRKPIYRDR
jgi:enoyl-CoA hydratase/carnithine racemase